MGELLHQPHFDSPNILEFKLDALDWEQEAEEGVVHLDDVWAEHQVQGPEAPVVQAQAAPRVLLVGLRFTHESPVFKPHVVDDVVGFMGEAQVGSAIVQLDVVPHLDGDADEDGLLLASFDLEHLELFVDVLHLDLMRVHVHEFYFIGEVFFSEEHFSLAGHVGASVVYDGADLAQACLAGAPDLDDALRLVLRPQHAHLCL